MTLGYTDHVAPSGFVEIDHTADWALRAHGTDLADLLAQAAGGMLSLAGAVPLPGPPASSRTLTLRSADRESLLVRWLEELLFIVESEGMQPREMRLNVQGRFHLRAVVGLSPTATLTRSIKAVTFHDLRVTDTGDGLEAKLVFDV
jgi:SHS2 domain-containing protein